MGSLASRPKVPAVQTVYMPVYTPSPAAPVPSPVTPSTPAPTPKSETDTETGQRSANLLERRRGVLSTVLTGFRGLLKESVTPQRKSLLGE